MGGDVPGDHAARADHRTVADGDPGQHRHVSAQPHVVPHGDGGGALLARGALGRVQGMDGSIKAAIGPHQYPLPEGDRGAIQNHQVIVGEKALSHEDIFSIVTFEARLDGKLPGHAAQQLGQQGPTLLALVRGEEAQLMAQDPGALPQGGELRVDGVVRLAADHLFPLSHFRYALLLCMRVEKTGGH